MIDLHNFLLSGGSQRWPWVSDLEESPPVRQFFHIEDRKEECMNHSGDAEHGLWLHDLGIKNGYTALQSLFHRNDPYLWN